MLKAILLGAFLLLCILLGMYLQGDPIPALGGGGFVDNELEKY